MTLTHLLIFAAVSGGAALALGLVYLIYRAAKNSPARWSDLITDPTGGVSSTKLWTHAVNTVVLVLTVRICWHATASDATSVVWLFVAVLALVGGSQAAMKAFTARIGGAPAPGTTVTRSSLEEERVVTGDAAAPAVSVSSSRTETVSRTPATINESAVNQRTGGNDVPKA